MPDYTLVPALDHASIGDYVALFDQAFGGDGKLGASYLQWQYVDNPHGRVIGYDAYAGDELAAHYAIIPRRYRLGTQIFEAALSVNTATHPRHQGKGLFTKLAAATYERAAQRGFRFVVGAANANSVGGFTRKLGFEALGQIRLYATFKAPGSGPQALDIDVDAHWLEWRLANPSRAFAVIRHGDGSATLRTHVRAAAFSVGRVSAALLPQGLASASPLLPALSPYYGDAPPTGMRLPLRLQPSPWHMIWKSLDPSLDPSLTRRLRFDGLAMDTF
jgi:GNAT superfamily N-acetyltransferase